MRVIARALDDQTLLTQALGENLKAQNFSVRQLSTLLGMEVPDLMRELQVPNQQASSFAAALELGRRAATAENQLDTPLSSGADLVNWLRPRVAGVCTECFYAVYLNAKGVVLSHRRISEGTLTASLVHPREVFAPAILYRAAAIIVAHNHPSGDPQPSAEDRATTRRLQRAGRLLGISLLDHIVVSGGGYVSFLEKGWL